MNAMDQFPLITGYLSLDLVNTEVVKRGRRYELLKSGLEIKLWVDAMIEAGSLYSLQFTDADLEWTDETRNDIVAFRAELRRLLESAVNGQTLQKDWHAPLEQRLRSAPLSYKWVDGHLLPVPMGRAADALTSLVALDALKLFESPERNWLRRCTNPHCPFLFVDKSGRRKWCSMRICGNRTKVARHQQKKLGGATKRV